MRFLELHPKMTGIADGLDELMFDCPKCGPPHVIYVKCKLNGPTDQSKAIWGYSFNNDCWGSFTLFDSIQNHHHGRKPCGCHVTVRDGEVTIQP